ncbi:MAG: ChaN family lipoprotein [Verrucomicrobia bacterium]|nr:ChaN family lipoprotein [Verrucomicrobiota bacterium]
MRIRSTTRALLSALALLAGATAGCSTPQAPGSGSAKTALASEETPAAAQACVFYNGKTGERLDWPSVHAIIAAADIVLVGEQHDNVHGHRLEAALTDAFLRQAPHAAIALEMFERHEQGLVDLYLDGRITAAALVSLTDSANWGGGANTWMDWYQPIVDLVKARRFSGAALVAANAPRTYAKLARIVDFNTLRQLPATEQTLFGFPDSTVDDRAYRERFLNHIQDASHAMSGEPTSYYRAQQVWDATMAESVVRAYQRHHKVMLFVGEFHLAHQGGILQHTRRAVPEARISTLSILRSATPDVFGATDTGRADIIGYTQAADDQ